MARYTSANQSAQTAANAPFQSYGGQFVAPTNATQNAGIAQAYGSANEAQPYFGAATNTLQNANSSTQPYYGAATGLAAASAAPVNAQQIGPDQINQFLSPYLGTVLGSESALLNQNNQQQQQGALGDAIRNGSFGGDRAGITAANLEQQQNLSNANIYGNILNTGYNNALGAAQQQQEVNLSAGQANRAALAGSSGLLSGLGQTIYGQGANTSSALAGLGTGAQSAAQSGAASELAAGQVQQQTQQAQDTAQYNQFLQQQSYPFQTAQFLANIAEGTGALSGSTTTTTQPGGFFSDERLKEGVKPVGKTYDGQTIYSYRYKGENKTQIGLIAQDVEKKYPHAVGLAGGYKTVDYGKATDDSAERGKFRRGGFAYGGQSTIPGVGPVDLAAMLAAQEQSYAPFSGSGLYGGAASGAPHGGSSYVPQANLPVSHLAVAGGLAANPKSAVQNMNDWANLAKAGSSAVKDVRGLMPSNDNAPGIGSNPEADRALGDEISAVGAMRKCGGVVRRARGGLAAAYAGGGMPYADQTGDLGLDIPDDPNSKQLATSPSLSGGHDSGGSDMAGMAMKLLPMLLAMKRGGRVGYADGGGYVPNSSDVPPSLATGLAAAMPGAFPGPAMSNPNDSANVAYPDFVKRPTTVADVARYLGPNAPVHVTPHPSGGLAVTPADPNMPNGPSIGSNPDADSALGAQISAVGNLGTPPNSDPTMSNLPSNLSDLAAPGTGLPSNIKPDKSGLSGVAGDALHGIEGAADKAGNWLAPKNGFFSKLAQGKTEAVIPFLTAIAAMGTAPTRSLGVALASGLGAGAQSFMGTQKQQAEIAQTQAEAGRTGAQTGQANLQISLDLARREALGLVRKDPGGPIVDPGTGIHYSNTQGAPSTGGAPGATPQGGPTYKFLGPSAQAALPKSAHQYMVDAPGGLGIAPNPGNIATSQKTIDDTYGAAASAQGDITNLNEQANAILSAKEGPLKQGALAPVFEPYVAKWNSLMQDVGHPEWGLQGGLGDTQIAEKLRLGQASALATGAGQHAYDALSQFLTSSAGPGLDRHAAATLMAQMAVNSTRAIDKRNALEEAKQNAPMGNFEAQDIMSAFDHDTPPTQYNAMRDNIASIYEGPTWQKISAALAKPNSPEYVHAVKVLDTYGQQRGIPRFSRAFTGG